MPTSEQFGSHLSFSLTKHISKYIIQDKCRLPASLSENYTVGTYLYFVLQHSPVTPIQIPK